MTDSSSICDLLPVAAPHVERCADLVIKVDLHPPIIAKFCALDKQPIAGSPSQSSAMEKKTLNQVLAENLAELMQNRQLSDKQLGLKASVSPRTIANYRNGPGTQPTHSGNERSAKLAELERIAEALGIDPVALLTDKAAQAKRVADLADAARAILSAPVSAGYEAGATPGSISKQRRQAA